MSLRQHDADTPAAGALTHGRENRRCGRRRYGAMVLCVLMATIATGVDSADATYPGAANGRLAFGIDFGGNVDIYSVRPSGQGLRRLTTASEFDGCPAYSADGGDIAYCHGVSGPGGVFEIWMMKANGTDHRQVTNLGGQMTFPDFSPDGTKIAFSGLAPGATAEDVYVINVDGSDLVRLTDDAAHDQYPAWSPDGSSIAFVSARSGKRQIWVMDADGANQRQLTFDEASKFQLPDWSPDGTKIAYATMDPVLGSDIWVMDADGTNQRQLTNRPVVEIGPAWSPDGTKIAFLNGLPDRYVNVMNADGSGRYVILAEGLQYVPAWQPVGTDPPAEPKNEAVCVGTLAGGTFDAVVVPTGAACVLTEASVRGSVIVRGDATLQAIDNDIGGDVGAQDADGVRLVGNHIAGNVHIRGGGPAPPGFPNTPEYLLCGNTLSGGDIVIERVTGGVGVRYFAPAGALEACSAGNVLARGHIVVRDNDITRVLRVHHNAVRRGHVVVSGNRISGPFSFVDANVVPKGHLFVEDNLLTGSRAHVESNLVGRSVFFVRNTGPALKHVRHNVVTRNLVCEGNEDPLILHPNSTGRPRGQCARTRTVASSLSASVG